MQSHLVSWCTCQTGCRERQPRLTNGGLSVIPASPYAEKTRGSSDSHIFYSFLECAFVSSHVNDRFLKQVQSKQIEYVGNASHCDSKFNQSRGATAKGQNVCK